MHLLRKKNHLLKIHLKTDSENSTDQKCCVFNGMSTHGYDVTRDLLSLRFYSCCIISTEQGQSVTIQRCALQLQHHHCVLQLILCQFPCVGVRRGSIRARRSFTVQLDSTHFDDLFIISLSFILNALSRVFLHVTHLLIIHCFFFSFQCYSLSVLIKFHIKNEKMTQ